MIDESNALIIWLEQEITSRNWSARELARRAGISSASVLDVLNQRIEASYKFCMAIASALKVSPENVLRKADLLPPDPQGDIFREALYLFNNLPDDQQALILTMMRALREKTENAQRPNPA